MEVIKFDGTRAPFDPGRVRKSVMRTGASRKLADEVVSAIQGRMHDGMRTKEIYAMVREELEKRNVCFACRYNLRDALLKLGPAGYKFEKYVASILRAHQYDAHVPEEEYQGSCVLHEIDVIAEKDGRRVFIEAKFRNDYRDVVNLKDTMATWSRFLDLVDGAAVGTCPHFDECWIVTNARFTERAAQFGTCKGIHMIGWNTPQERSFAQLVDIVALYPVTVLTDHVTQSELESLSDQGIMLCKEAIEFDPENLAARTDLSPKRSAEIIDMCRTVVDGDKKRS